MRTPRMYATYEVIVGNLVTLVILGTGYLDALERISLLHPAERIYHIRRRVVHA